MEEEEEKRRERWKQKILLSSQIPNSQVSPTPPVARKEPN